ncbi:MAG: response regulator transcription factor [Anaerolineae bacterium]|nr:response regulator transcription factor [Anaerolineae bacterium]
MIRVLIADDHMVVREGLHAILDIAPDLLPVGEATDGAEAVRLVQESAPDVVLMDLRMPGMDGIEAIRQIKARYPDVQIVILTTYDDDDYIVRGLRAGARGYLLKDTSRKVLFETIRAAARGESLLPSEVIDKVVAHLQGPQQVAPETLSKREGQVLALLAQGATNKEVALQLSISERTVKAHVTSIFNKLGASSRAEAVSIALRSGLLPAGPSG